MKKKLNNTILFFFTILIFFSSFMNSPESSENIFMTDEIQTQYETNINKIRKGEFLIKFIDSKKTPMAGMEVRLKQQQHEFQFGGALFTPFFELTTNKEIKEKLLQRANEMFSIVVDGNGFKWPSIEKERGVIDYGISRHYQSTNWAKENQKKLRHHTLFWSNPQHIPEWALALNDDEFRQAIFNRINYTKEKMGSDISSLDVVNEMLYFNSLRSRLGEGIIKEIFDETKKAFPDSKLYINEWPAQPEGSIKCIENKDFSCFNDYITLINTLKEKEIPFDGVGLQGHFDADGLRSSGINIDTLMAEFSKVIDNISAAAGLPVFITEYDMKTKDEQIRADFLEAFYTMIFSNINVEGIITWEWFGESSQRALVKDDGSLTQAGIRYYDLIFEKWNTNRLFTTNDSGQISADVFYGDYTIEISINGKSINKSIRLYKKSLKQLEVELAIETVSPQKNNGWSPKPADIEILTPPTNVRIQKNF